MLKIAQRVQWMAACLAAGCLCLMLGCGGSSDFGMMEFTGIGYPLPGNPSEQKRLEAVSNARDDAWEKIYEHVSALPLSGDRLILDRLLTDPALKARVISHIWNAKIVKQTYDPATEMATVILQCDISKVYDLL